MKTVYIDQNIVQYAYEKKLILKHYDEFEWVYSDEHLAEMIRSNKINMLRVLKDIKSRHIKIYDNKFKITDSANLEPFRDPEIVLQEYKDTIREAPQHDFGFTSLQTFFQGNKNAIDPKIFTEKFKEGIAKLTEGAFDNIDGHESKAQFDLLIDVLASELCDTLSDAREQIKPLSEMRKSISKTMFSNLRHENGPIIDQIWAIISTFSPGITKDQFFGKEHFPFKKQEKIPFLLGIAKCHSGLNYVGYWPDEKMSSLSKVYGINSDASHIGHAAFCSALMSADDRLCKKARAIYEYFNVGTIIFQVRF